MTLGQAAEPVAFGVVRVRDPQRAGDQVQVHAQLVETEAVFVKAGRRSLA